MNKEPEALRLAEWWDQQSHNHALTPESKTATELRRLHAVNAELLAALKAISKANQLDYIPDWISIWIQADAAISKAEGEQK